MYLNGKNFIFKTKNNFNSKNDYYNFRCHLLKSNLNKYSSMSFIVLFILIVFLIIDVILLRYFPNTIILYLDPIIIIIAIISSILNIMVNKYLNSKVDIKNVKIISLIFSYSLILWGIYIIFNINNYSNSFYIYMLFQLVFMILLYDMPINKLIYHTIFFISIIIFIFNNNSAVQRAFYILLKVFFIYAFSIAISFISFSYALNNFLNNLKLKQSNEKLIELENAKTNYFTNVSHELRTPLNIILTSQDLLKLELKENNHTSENINKYLNITKQNSLRLTRLINNLIDITKIDSSSLPLNKQNINIISVIEDITMSSVEYINSKDIKLIFDTNLEEKYTYCDPDAIERIILNLLSNSIKFTPKGGKIIVEINCTNDNISISIKDTGIGIDKNTVDKIFNRYFQVESNTNTLSHKGSGIGLSLVKSLVELHDGEISVVSEINKGTTFTITLPIVLSKEPIKNNTDSSIRTNEKIEIINLEFSDIYNY